MCSGGSVGGDEAFHSGGGDVAAAAATCGSVYDHSATWEVKLRTGRCVMEELEIWAVW